MNPEPITETDYEAAKVTDATTLCKCGHLRQYHCDGPALYPCKNRFCICRGFETVHPQGVAA